ncbi:MAG: hypothetical protein DBY30_07415 [Verrucomicrobia bacterium]|nr:MAG: hypothetical protein DBY30_07415 [Verrucomicrobiota bacterium]
MSAKAAAAKPAGRKRKGVMKNSKFLGIVLAAIGVFCLVYPIAASVWIEIVAGACFIAASFFTLLGVSARRGAWDKAYGALLTVLYFAAGGLMLLNPFEGVMMLMVLIGAIFTFEGVAAVALWGTDRNSPNSWLMLVNGAVTVALGALALFNPSYGVWFIGTLAGIDLLFSGIALIARGADA